MKDELQKKLREDLEKTGFVSEMKAIRIFSQANWITSGSGSYYDLDSNITREIDITAHISRTDSLSLEHEVQCFYQIVAEVKKSTNPWIAFKQHINWSWQLLDAWNNLITSLNLPKKHHLVTDALSVNSLPQTLKWLGYGIHESFKEPKVTSQWYSAFMSACKAGESALLANTRKEPKQEQSKGIYFFFVKPLVIIDGDLISAELTNTGEIVLTDIDSAPFEFSFRSPNYDRLSYHVDVVRLSGLVDYLKLSEARLDGIFEALKKTAIQQ